ncbi:MAG: acyl-CoA/acyl-ACP dehydrogenase [Rhodocyclaceae bacterium]|nr:acyl-CoA/acyl-ACP dehydrogenase [Rhodocyclaceae bacterium]
MNANAMAAAAADRADERRLLKESVAAFVERCGGATRARAMRGRSPGFDRAVWREFADLGWLAVTLPEQYGGLGLSLTEMAVIAEELGGALAPEPVIEAITLAAGVLRHAGGSVADELLPPIAAGEIIPTLAWQESDGNFDPAHVAATATADTTGGIRLNGSKAFVPHADAADGFIVTARDEQGLALYWIPADAPGVEIVLRPLATGAMVGCVSMKQVEVAPTQRIAAGRHAADALHLAIDEATVMASAALVGLIGKALNMTLDYIKVRTQFGKPIGSFQAIQHRAVDLYIQCELAQGALGDALAAHTEAPRSKAAQAATSRAKARCSDVALLICREAVQMHGAIGFTDEYDLGLYLNRALVLAAWLGNSAQHRRRYAAIGNASTQEASA